MRFKLRVEELFEAAIRVRPLQPFGDRKGVLLVGRSSFAWESPAPKRRVDLGDHRAIGRQAPTVERPEMHAVFSVLPDVAQPRNSCVRGLRYRPLHVEMEHGFGCTCSQFGQPPPARIAGARRSRFRHCRHGQNQRRCPRRSASGAGNHRGRTASRAAIRAARSIAAGMKNRGRCRRASAVPRRASQPATQQCPCESSICED